MILLKICLFISLSLVVYQDTKDRMVSWILFPIIAIFAGTLLYRNTPFDVLFTTLITNISFMIILVFLISIYSELKLNSRILEVFGMGDILLFFALAFTFSSYSFIILFVFGLIFSLSLHFYFKKKSKYQTVPLAGYLSLFFNVCYLTHWANIIKLYTF